MEELENRLSSISLEKQNKHSSNETKNIVIHSTDTSEKSNRHGDEYKIVPVTSNIENQILTSTTLTRNEIKGKRIERKKVKQIENKRIRDQKLLEEKINKRSEKIRIITSKVHQNYQNNIQEENQIKKQQKFKKYNNNNNFNLLDFIIEKSKNKKPLKQIKKYSKITIKLNKGKRRENKIKKSYSRLKKIILKNRQAKKRITTTVDPVVDIQLNIEKKLNDETIIPKSLTTTIHSRKFRPYCDNLTSTDLCNLTEKILRELFRFQKRAYEKNELKAQIHKRFVVGFKETKSQLEINKLKFIIIAPDCEACNLPGGIDETISLIKLKCKNKNIPYLFSLKRRQLGYILYKKVPVHCIGIISYDGVQDIFHELIKCLNNDRENYMKTINNQQDIK